MGAVNLVGYANFATLFFDVNRGNPTRLPLYAGPLWGFDQFEELRARSYKDML